MKGTTYEIGQMNPEVEVEPFEKKADGDEEMKDEEGKR